MSFYESDPIEDAPFLELPSMQYGSWGMPGSFRRNNYSLLEPARIFLWQNYAPLIYIIPKSAIIAPLGGVAKFDQIEDRVQLRPGSFLLALSGMTTLPAGFRFSLFDEGSADYVLSDKWENWTDVDFSTPGHSQPHMLPEPYCVVSPGRLQVRVVNLANDTNDFQLALHFAVPKGTAQ